MSEGPNINTWSWVTGAFGVVTVLPLLYAILVAHLPASQIKALEEALATTNQLLESVIEKGLLSDADYINQSRNKLASIDARASDLKMSAYGADTASQQLKGLLTGLSYNIHCLRRQVNKICANISTTTSAEKRRLEREDAARPSRRAQGHDATESLWLPWLAKAQETSDSEGESVDIADLMNPFIRVVELPYQQDGPPASQCTENGRKSLVAQ